MYPKETKSKDRAYTREEIQKMMSNARSIMDKVIITMFSSGGFRLESWEYFTWEDVIFLKNKDDTFKGAALKIYHGFDEEYWTFITPEACKYLHLYREEWKSEIGQYPKSTDPLLRSMKYKNFQRLNQKGVRKRVDVMAKLAGLRPPLPPNRKRHSVKLDHGFRKFFNTMLRRAKVDYLDKADMMGHKSPAPNETSYERYIEEDFERFPEYQKAIPFLTISDEERDKVTLMQKQQENNELEKKNQELEEKNKKINRVEKISQDLAEKMRDITSQGLLTDDIKRYVRETVLENLEE